MPRGAGRGGGSHKPQSTKAKKKQLQEKRDRKRGTIEGSDSDTGDAVGSGVHDASIRDRMTTSLGKSGHVNQFSTVFVKESDEAVAARKNTSDEPIDLSRRSKGLFALKPADDPVLNHPRGLLNRSHATLDGFVDAHTEAEAAVVEAREDQMFQEWIDTIYARYSREELNHFEHNVQVWRQLWRVTGAADVICIVADVRNPLYHIPTSLYHEITHRLCKPLIILLNKADLVPQSHLDAWTGYLRRNFLSNTRIVPFTACGADLTGVVKPHARMKIIAAARKSRDEATLSKRLSGCLELLKAAGAEFAVERVTENVMCGHGKLKAAGGKGKGGRPPKAPSVSYEERRLAKARERLSELKHSIEDAVGSESSPSEEEESESESECRSDEGEMVTDAGINPFPTSCDDRRGSDTGKPRVVIGFVGHPNVGKSSVINTICGEKRVSVSRTPGHTKWFQSIDVCEGLRLLDCPGLVFPYAFVHKPTEAVHSTPLAHTDSTSSTDDDDIDTAARRDVDIEYTGIDSIDRQRAMQECCGVVPLSQLREPYSSIRLIAEHLPIEQYYGLKKPPDEESWSPLVICEAFAEKKGYRISKGHGRLDAHRAGREIVQECADGVLCLLFSPPKE